MDYFIITIGIKLKSMRSLFCLSILFCFVFNCRTQSWELAANGKDTINKIDFKKQKQGNWIIRGHHKRGGCYNLNQIIEEGEYINNRKTGLWTEHYCNGKLRNKLTYVNGVLEGYAIFYNTDEKILKEGSFKGNKWGEDKIKASQ
jgi:hypothetical protein